MRKKFDKKTVITLVVALAIIFALCFGVGTIFGDKLSGLGGGDMDEIEQELMDYATEQGYSYNDEGLVSYGNGTNVFTFGDENTTIELSAFMQTNGEPNWDQVTVTCFGKKPDEVVDNLMKSVPVAIGAYRTAGGEVNSDEVLGALDDNEAAVRKTIGKYGKKQVEDKNWDYDDGYIGVKYKEGLYYAGMVFTGDFTR